MSDTSILYKISRVWHVAQLVTCLLHKHEDLTSDTQLPRKKVGTAGSLELAGHSLAKSVYPRISERVTEADNRPSLASVRTGTLHACKHIPNKPTYTYCPQSSSLPRLQQFSTSFEQLLMIFKFSFEVLHWSPCSLWDYLEGDLHITESCCS